MTKLQCGHKLKRLISDKGEEFISTKFVQFCNVIRIQLTMAYTPQKNGLTESKNRDCKINIA